MLRPACTVRRIVAFSSMRQGSGLDVGFATLASGLSALKSTPRVRDLVARAPTRALPKGWRIGDDIDELFDAGRANLAELMRCEEAREYLVPPVAWLMPDREAFGRKLCRQMALLGTEGRLKQAQYIALTGQMGVGTSTVLRGTLDLVHAAVPGATGGPTLFPAGTFFRPMLVEPVNSARPFQLPPSDICFFGSDWSIPLPPVLHAVEVLRAHGFHELPGAAEAPDEGVDPRDGLNWARWHPDAFAEDALCRLSEWCEMRRVHPCIAIDTLEVLLHANVDRRFARMWIAQLAAPARADSRLAALFCFGGSSEHLFPLLFTQATAQAEKFDARQNTHTIPRDRVQFCVLSRARTRAEVEWMILNTAWPSQSQLHPDAARVCGGEGAPDTTGRSIAGDQSSGSAGDRGGAASLESLFRETRGLPRFLASFARTGDLDRSRWNVAFSRCPAPSEGLDAVRVAIASHLARSGVDLTSLVLSPIAEQLRQAPYWIAGGELEQSLELLGQLAKPEWLSEIASWKAPPAASLHAWDYYGHLSYHDGSKVGLPTPLCLSRAWEKLAGIVYHLDPAIIRSILHPTSADRSVSAHILGATLCHGSPAGVQTLGHFTRQLVAGASVPAGDLECLKRDLKQTQLRWTRDDSVDALAALRRPGSFALVAPGVWPFRPPYGRHYDKSALCLPSIPCYCPGVHLFGIVESDVGSHMVVWLLVSKLLLSPPRAETALLPEDVSVAAADFHSTLQNALRSGGMVELEACVAKRAGKPAVVRPLVVLATTAAATAARGPVAAGRGQQALSRRGPYQHADADRHSTVQLVPRKGVGLLLDGPMLAPHWPPPIRMFAHEHNLGAYGGRLASDDDAAALALRMVCHRRGLLYPGQARARLQEVQGVVKAPRSTRAGEVSGVEAKACLSTGEDFSCDRRREWSSRTYRMK